MTVSNSDLNLLLEIVSDMFDLDRGFNDCISRSQVTDRHPKDQ
jgi:hypothetical protein